MIDLSPPTPLWERAREGKLQDTDAMLHARDWLASAAWGIALLSPVGSGKSQAAAWLWLAMRHEAVAHAQRPGHFDAAGEVLWLRARSLQRLGLDDRGEVLERLSRAYAVVIDELGSEDHYKSASPRMALSDLIEERGDHRRRTIITSNLETIEGFYKTYGDRLASRFHGAGRNLDESARWVVQVEGPDLRGHVPDHQPTAESEDVTDDRKREILDELAAEGVDIEGVKAMAKRARG